MGALNRWVVLSPEIYLIALILFILSLHLFSKKISVIGIIRGSSFGTLPLFILLYFQWPISIQRFYGSFEINSFSTFFKGLFVISIIPVLAMTAEFLKILKKRSVDFCILLLIALLGSFFLASAHDLITLFITVEWLTLSLYILTAYLRTGNGALEAGTKYLIMGAFSAALFLYGISLIYGATGSLNFDQIRMVAVNLKENHLFTVGFLLILAGIGFKISAFPFHLWAPDVYQGAPTPITAFLSIVSKTAGFLALLKFLFLAVGVTYLNWPFLVALISALTLLYGNLGALGQSNMKRLFAYSSIGHAGYLLMGMAGGNANGIEATLFYLVAYCLSNALAFLVITIVNRELKGEEISIYRGLAKKNPKLAGAFFIALLSLGGIPPLAGFFGKFLVIQSALSSGYLWLALLGAVNVITGLYYYLSIVKEMYFPKLIGASGGKEEIKIGLLTQFLLLLLAILIIILGIFQEPVFNFAHLATQNLF
jgi:NADH-quinone oxidoreductase subunit N